ncbi:myosin-13 [Hydra vulgaris]|uniref:myosin-13 n=1 Tax=Hydra vulgaris TaxID=6087 RepID=UPI0006417437|nr:myosin-13-like [Hydra vulgaris]
MDLKSFEAFKGNSIMKASSSFQNRSGVSSQGFSSSKPNIYNFDALWKGSVSNLMSSENITEDLIKESIKELENAMQESRKMLIDRDDEIAKLRLYIKNNDINEDDNYGKLADELKKSQETVALLECQIKELEQKNKIKELEQKNKTSITNTKTSITQEQKLQNFKNNIFECTCGCGLECKALIDLLEAKQTLQKTKDKYDILKRKVREFRKQAEINHKNALRLSAPPEEKTGCYIQ